jgi:hypothetical protein
VLSDSVVLPSAGDAENATEALSLLLDMAVGGQILVDNGGIAVPELVAAIAGWRDGLKRERAARVLRKLRDMGRLIPVPPGPPQVGCSDGCNTLRGVVEKWNPALIFSGAGCIAEVSRDVVLIGDYVGSDAQARLRRQAFRLTRGTTEDDLEREVLAPFLRFAESLVVADRYIGRSIQDNIERGGRAEVSEGFTRTIRLLMGVYANESRVRGRSVRVVTGLQSHRPTVDAQAALGRWANELAIAYPAVPVTVDVRQEERGARQLGKDRYLISNQGAILVTRGLDLLFTDRQMREAGFDPTRDARRVHTTTLTLLPPATDVLMDAEDLPLMS